MLWDTSKVLHTPDKQQTNQGYHSNNNSSTFFFKWDEDRP